MILIKDIRALYTAWDAPVQEGTDILIRDNRIEKVGRGLRIPAEGGGYGPPAEDQVIDGSQLAVVPGLVNTHHHFYQTLTRNLPAVQEAKLFDWLVYLYEVWKHLDAESILNSSLLAMGELLKTGCTCTTDHHYLYPRGVDDDVMGLQFQAARQLGMRFAPTRGSMSLSRKDGGLPPDSVVQTEEEILADSERVIRAYHDPEELSMGRVILAPCSPFSVTKELMKESAALARRHPGVRLHTHLAETNDEDDFCMKIYGKRPLELMEECGFIGPDVFFAHGIFFNDAEMDRLEETGTGVAHCPSSNMRLGSGICRVREMVDRDMPVSIAVDGSASNDTSDMLGELRQALLLQRVARGPAGLSAREAFRMATVNGARMLGFQKTGRLEPGWGADLAGFRLDTLGYSGALSDPLAALLFAGDSHLADLTVVNGRPAVLEGQLTGLDEAELTDRMDRITRDLYRRAGI